jgi:hypothetical protein
MSWEADPSNEPTDTEAPKPGNEGHEMNRRNFTTTAIVVAAGLLLYSGVTLAREAQTADDHRDQVVATQPATATDDSGRATASPELEPTASPDDKGGHGADDTAQPTASPDDKGGHGADDTAQPTASPDDKGGHGADDGN